MPRIGFIASGFNGPTPENGVFYYDANTGGWITFGNVVTGPYSSIDNTYKLPDGRMFTYRQHELGHIPQGTLLGPGYILAHAVSLTVGATIGTFTGSGVITGSHQYNVLENYWHPAPAY